MTGDTSIEEAVRRAATGRALVLAVSGGLDSMVLLHAAARAARGAVRVVATFDHGTGAAATRATHFVAAEAARLALPCVIGRAGGPGVSRSEADWRRERLAFLADVAAREGGVITTAHTRDDQVETVLMRVLRQAGARGLAGLYAPGEVARPLLEHSRAQLVAHARDLGLRWVDDPTNASMRYFRNRVRRDLLPALRRAHPGFDDELLALAHGAADWRRRVDDLAARISHLDPFDTRVSVAVDDLAGYSRAQLAVLWPAIAARVGLAMDRRGTVRAAEFTTGDRVGARMQLSGGWQITRGRGRFELSRWR